MAKKTSSGLDLDNISASYLFTGEVDSRRGELVAKLKSAIVSPGSELFDLEEFDGDSTSASQILQAAMSMPFGSSRKVIVVDRVDRLSADDQGKIAAFIPKFGAQSCLIMLSGDENPAKRKSAAQAKQSGASEDGEETAQPKSKKGLQPALSSAVKKYGTVIEFAKMRAQDVTALIAEKVKAHGKKIDSSALQMFSFSMQSTPPLIDREVEKLAAFLGERNTITVADVENVTTRSPEDRVFPLIDAVAAGRADTAVRLLNETLAASTKPDGEVLKVLALLGRHFRMLYQVQYLIGQGVHRMESMPEEMRAMLMREVNPATISDWQRQKFLEQSRHFTQEELRRSLKNILTCELAVKGQSKTSTNPRLNLEMLVLKLSQRKSLS
ncbi:MAG TPA: DNA polymerase III subunit delta [Armatimonadota bacterium]|jgi:DNA polymerase-3 subunit delta